MFQVLRKNHSLDAGSNGHTELQLFLQRKMRAIGSRRTRILGVKSTWYIYSDAALNLLNHHFGHAKIIICLRDPAELLWSWHRHMIRLNIQPIGEFAKALEQKSLRKTDSNIILSNQDWKLDYQLIGSIQSRVERAKSIFGDNRVHVIHFDAIKKGLLQETWNFLEATTMSNVKIIHENHAHGVRSKTLEKLLTPSSKLVTITHKLGASNTGIGSILRYMRQKLNHRPDASSIPDISDVIARRFSEDAEFVRRHNLSHRR